MGELRGWYALAYLAASVDATPRRTNTLSFPYHWLGPWRQLRMLGWVTVTSPRLECGTGPSRARSRLLCPLSSAAPKSIYANSLRPSILAVKRRVKQGVGGKHKSARSISLHGRCATSKKLLQMSDLRDKVVGVPRGSENQKVGRQGGTFFCYRPP